MGTDAEWDALLDLEAEIAILDEQYLYKLLGRINHLCDRSVETFAPEYRKPLLAIMGCCHEARRRLIDG